RVEVAQDFVAERERGGRLSGERVLAGFERLDEAERGARRRLVALEGRDEVVEHEEPHARRGLEEERMVVALIDEAGVEIGARAERLDGFAEERFLERVRGRRRHREEAIEAALERVHELTSRRRRTVSSKPERSSWACRRKASSASRRASARSKSGSRPGSIAPIACRSSLSASAARRARKRAAASRWGLDTSLGKRRE